jgi:PST family polysaccharide transporter/teichuronic acid exporter
MSIKKQAVTGVKWTTLGTITVAVLGILKYAILSRFVEKSDFGLMALVMLVFGFIKIFGDLGLTTAILHKQGISKKEYASLYWLNLLVSIGLFGLLWVLSPFVAQFYEQPQLTSLIRIMGLGLIAFGFGNQFKIMEEKHLLFDKISKIEIVSSVCSLILAVVLATNGYGVLALVYSLLFQFVFANVGFLVLGLAKYGLLFRFSLSDTKPFLSIGSYQLGSQAINYFNREMDVFLIGKLFSEEILGGYSLAKLLVFRPMMVLNPIMSRVAAPALALFQSKIEELKQAYLKLLNLTATANIVVYLGIILFAPIIVEILYPDYDDIVILVRILSVYMLFRAIGNPIGSLITATGKTNLGFLWNVASLIVMPVFIYIGSRYGIVGTAVSMVVAMLVLFFPSWRFLVYRMTGATFGEFLLALVPRFRWEEIKEVLK